MTVIRERMDSGIPGEISRKLSCRIEAGLPAAAMPDLPFGSPVQLDGEGRIAALHDEAAPVYGFLVRPWPAQEGTGASADTAPGGRACDVLRSGYMTVRLGGSGSGIVRGTPVQAIFADGTLTASGGVPVSGAVFMGPPDASGNIEIAFNI